ncbi:AAA family ATPase [Magnetospirillum sp. UT-4]|uniref:bifunctional aminoglycoside phosphotransferase/ATP-binding protein n=1 Tax=Magnetospirillum sp. UT-4 TaxID=2681467 RepID=UPI001380D379|nr:AAA family ATPase [Magnetospirillum sp. UT-4]CAA7626469.1 conserved hypothetical protein [Magnetospirillum sp. UT-4]
MDPQAETLAFLGRAATHGGARPQRVDTHISAVFLAGDRAWKLKRAVRLPFLDFSTVEQRHAACAAELAVNAAAAPDLYLGVVPVTRGEDGHLAIGGAGTVVDWLVEMRRFDQRTLFSRLAAGQGLDRHRIHALTEAVWRFHRAAAVRPDKGGVAGLTWTIDTNAATMAGLPDFIPPARARDLAEASRTALARLAPLLEARRAEGRVRRCHGDLHLGNICLFQGRPTLFDAIEFSEDIGCIDVFYDLAFLLMDLDRRGRRGLASTAMNHYLDLSGDYGAVALLPLFLSLRAAIRAHVAATTAAAATAAPRRDELAAEATRYLDSAFAYLSPPPPRLLAVGGLSGSGKSRMGRELAPFLAVPGAIVVRSDALRKQLMGADLLAPLGPEGYTPEITERTYQALYDTCRQVLAAGHAAVADAVFARPDQREAIERVARQSGLPFDGLWLETPPHLAARRIKGRRANASDATVAVLKRQLDYDLGPIAWTRINTGGSKAKALADGRAAIGV